MTDMTVAETILAQLGGRRFTIMTGAKDYIANEKSLRMKLPSNMTKGKITHLRITLDAMDTYKVETFRCRAPKYDMTPVETVEGVFAETLRPVFERVTNLYTSL